MGRAGNAFVTVVLGVAGVIALAWLIGSLHIGVISFTIIAFTGYIAATVIAGLISLGLLWQIWRMRPGGSKLWSLKK